MYRRYDQRKGEHGKGQRSPSATLEQLEHEISLLENELDELKAYKKKLEENIEIRKKVSQNLELHKYGCGIVIITVIEDEAVFEFNPMVLNKCSKPYCMRVTDSDHGAFLVLKYYMPVYMDVKGLLKKPVFQRNIRKFLNHIHSCLIAYHDRKHQVMQTEKTLNKYSIKIANTMDYRLLEVTFNMDYNENKQIAVDVVLKYEDNEIRPRTISVECKDLSKEALEDIRAQLKDLEIYSLEVALQLTLLKDESSTQLSDSLNQLGSDVSIESATTAEVPQNHRQLEVDLGVYKRGRGRGRRRSSPKQHSAESGLEASEEEEDQNKQVPRRRRGSRGHGRGKHVPLSKEVQVEPRNRERGVGRRGKGRDSRRGSSRRNNLDISSYFERSKHP